METAPIIPRKLDDDEAIITLVDSIIQRDEILPSEKAAAYKMKLAAIKRQGKRTDLTSRQDGEKLDAAEIVGSENGDSGRQVQRYIRLTELTPELQQMVDDKKIALTPAVELSYLKPEEQAMLVTAMDYEQAAPSLSQAQRMKRQSQEGTLTEDSMLQIMCEVKKPTWDRITLKGEELRKYFPKNYTRFAPCKSSERDAAKDMIAAFDLQNVNNPVFIMDRGYPSADLMDAIIRAGYKFIMRCPTEFLRSMKLPEQDNILEHKFTKLKHPLKLRIVKLQLSDGNTEYLATNIFDLHISVDDFKWVYSKHWGIETKYNDVKNKLEIENFTGYSPDAILQDFYATMFLADLAGVLEYDLHEEIEAAHASPKNRYAYKMNIAMTILEMKRTVVEMLATTSRLKRERLYAKMTFRLMKTVVPVRPNRSSERAVKHNSMRFPHNIKRN